MTSTFRAPRTGAGADVHSPNPSDAQFDLLADFRTELQQLTATQRELLHELRSDSVIDLDAEELPRLRRENEELRSRVEELENLLRAKSAGDDLGGQQQNEYEKLLDEKSEVIRTLHLKIQQLQAGADADAAAEVHDAALERLKQELAEQRAQLEEDEHSLMEQSRNMEMALAKDRADLARQRTELQRQQADFAREVENASRDPQLHDRLASLRRMQHDNAHRTANPTSPAPAPKSSGLIRRIFG